MIGLACYETVAGIVFDGFTVGWFGLSLGVLACGLELVLGFCYFVCVNLGCMCDSYYLVLLFRGVLSYVLGVWMCLYDWFVGFMCLFTFTYTV